MKAIHTIAMPLGRVMIALMFVMSGIGKVFQYEGTQGLMESQGIPGALLPLVIVVEVIGGLAIILGLQTRLAAFLLAGFCVVSAIVFHANIADQAQMSMFIKNIAIAGGFLFLVGNGPGAYALDNR